ncbi:MAG: hypothetical protein CFH41_02559 [Alphaproteobacteria bacterium MarineAlpha11_Bin1]|nr:MAG: hypothetical protein CFH41_02559 [Alphaproteobacteria bacterium MarineAlpha11_Bin1]
MLILFDGATDWLGIFGGIIDTIVYLPEVSCCTIFGTIRLYTWIVLFPSTDFSWPFVIIDAIWPRKFSGSLSRTIAWA